MWLPLFRSQEPRPIFVVGSPRSGTSILTWCLGQHGNIMPLEEGGWMGDLSIDLGIRYRSGTMRGERSQLATLQVERDTLFEEVGKTIDRIVRGHRSKLERHCREVAMSHPDQIHPAFKISRSVFERKSRWVDGTPENSFYIFALKKLFPRAQFIHIVRDVKDVVRSMLYFEGREDLGISSRDNAFDYWLRTASACCAAEAELGSDVVHRVLYADLVDASEAALKGIFRFLDEPFSKRTLAPLARKINNSRFPASEEDIPGPESDLMAQAYLLSEGLKGGLPASDLPCTRRGLAEQFEERIEYLATVERRLTAELESRTAWALRLDKDVAEKNAYIRTLQEELAAIRQQTSRH